MFLDKLLFDEFDLALIKRKIFTRKQIMAMNMHSKLFVPEPKCKICGKKIKKGEVFIPNFGSIHTEKCLMEFHQKYKRKE